MSRRRLEAAIQAGKSIEQGKKWPEKFSGIKVTHSIPFDAERMGVYCLQFSLDGQYLAVGYGNGAIHLLSSSTGKLVCEIRQSRYGGFPIMCMRFHPLVQHILYATTAEGLIFACNTETGTYDEIITEKGNEINCLDFSADGYDFATGGKDLHVRLYDTKSLQMKRKYEGYDSTKAPTGDQSACCAQRVFALKFHPEIDYSFVTGGWENHLKVWDSRSNDGVKRTIHGPHVCGDSLDLQGFTILTGSWVANRALQIWDYSEGKLLKNVPFPAPNGAFLYCSQLCDNDVVLAGGSGTNSVQAVRISTGECIGTVKTKKAVQALDSVHGGRLFALGSGDEELIIASLI